MATLTALCVSLLLGPRPDPQAAAVPDRPGDPRGRARSRTRPRRARPRWAGCSSSPRSSLPTLLWADLRNPFVWIAVVLDAAFGAIGFADDYLKVARKRNLGLTARAQAGAAGRRRASALGVVLVLAGAPRARSATTLTVPVRQDASGPTGLGLRRSSSCWCWRARQRGEPDRRARRPGHRLGPRSRRPRSRVLAYAAGNAIVADYLGIANVKGAGELTMFCGALVGASLGFLWFNCHPAEVFMGDVGLDGARGCAGHGRRAHQAGVPAGGRGRPVRRGGGCR